MGEIEARIEDAEDRLFARYNLSPRRHTVEVDVSQIDAGLELVPASRSDAEELAELRVVAMRASLERIGRYDAERARSRFLEGFSPKATRHIVAGGSRVGFVAVVRRSAYLLLDHLYIHPDKQGVGIGSAVLLRVFAEADRANAAIRVGALRGSESNRFYLRHGFELVERAEWDNYCLRPAAHKKRTEAPCSLAVLPAVAPGTAASIDHARRLAAYSCGSVGSGQRCCWPLNADPLDASSMVRSPCMVDPHAWRLPSR